MKKFWLFSGDIYYPGGGMLDFRGSFDTLEEARAELPDDPYSWAHISSGLEILESYRRGKRVS